MAIRQLCHSSSCGFCSRLQNCTSCWRLHIKTRLAALKRLVKHSVMTDGPIIIVDDDKDDQAIYTMAIQALGITNEIIFFDGGRQALDYLLVTEDQPFIILSDVNMVGMNGLEFKKHIQDDPYLTTKGIPFVFISTTASKATVRYAHSLSVQGYFAKPNNIKGIQEMFRILFEYWALCKHINNT